MITINDVKREIERINAFYTWQRLQIHYGGGNRYELFERSISFHLRLSKTELSDFLIGYECALKVTKERIQLLAELTEKLRDIRENLREVYP